MGVECVQAHTLMFHVIPKQERAGTIGDGVKPGSLPAVGLGGANVQMWAATHTFEHFCPVPICFGLGKNTLTSARVE